MLNSRLEQERRLIPFEQRLKTGSDAQVKTIEKAREAAWDRKWRKIASEVQKEFSGQNTKPKPKPLIPEALAAAGIVGTIGTVGCNIVQQASAEGLSTPIHTPTPTPGQHLEIKGPMPSQQAFERQVQVISNQEIKIQTIENPINFTDSLVRQRKWQIRHGTSGIYPPNDPDEPTDTIDDYINNNYAISFQTKNSLYKETLDGSARTVIDGVQVNTQTGKGYLATAVIINNIAYQRIELISDINNPADYSEGARILFQDGIGDIAQKGDLGDFYKGNDSQGKYLDLVISRAVDPAKNGTYRLRLDVQGNFQGSFFKVIDTPTYTPTSSPTPTFSAFGFKIYIPLAMKQKSGGW